MSTNLIEISSTEQLEGVLSENKDKLIVMDFTATWCGPCRNIKPVFKGLADTHKDVIFLSIDVDANSEISGKYKIRAMPTFKFYKNDVAMGTMMGANSDKLKAYVENLKKPDAEPIEEGSSNGGGCSIF